MIFPVVGEVAADGIPEAVTRRVLDVSSRATRSGTAAARAIGTSSRHV